MRTSVALPRGSLVIGLATVMYIFLLFPSLIIVPVSFGNRVELVFPPADFTLDLYRDYFGSQSWLSATYRSALTATMVTIASLSVGVPAAYALARTRFIGRRILVAVLLSPILIPIVVISLGIYLYFAKISLNGTFLGLILAHTMYVTPFVIITVAAGINQIDERLESVATIMGAKRFYVFRKVVLPQLVHSLVASGLFAFLVSFDEVVIAWFVTGPSTMTLPVLMYSSIKWESSPLLAAVATLLTAVSIVVCLAAVAIMRARGMQNSQHS